MTEPTSAKAYWEEENSGRLSEKRKQVYDHIKDVNERLNRSCTASEVAEHIKGAWKRCSELEDQDMIKAVGTTTDPSTIKTVKTYRITGRTKPLPLNRNKTGKVCKVCQDRADRIRSILDSTNGFNGITDLAQAKQVIQGVRDTLRFGH